MARRRKVEHAQNSKQSPFKEIYIALKIAQMDVDESRQ